MPEILKKEIECTKEALEMGEGISSFIKATRLALSDGWQVGTDLPVVLSSALMTLIPAIEGMEKLKSEFEGNKEAFANSIYVGLTPIIFQFINDKKEK